MINIHSHVIPGIDDGSKDMDISRELNRLDYKTIDKFKMNSKKILNNTEIQFTGRISRKKRGIFSGIFK